LLVNRLISPDRLFRMGVAWYLLGAVIGVYLIYACGWWVLWLGLLGAAGGYFYTGGIALKYKALGDISVILLFGILITLGAFYVQAESLSWLPVLYSIPIGLLVDGILHGNNIRDISTDAEVGVVTLAGRMGPKGSRWFYVGLVVAAFLAIPVLVVADHLPWSSFIVFLSIPLAIRNVRLVQRSEDVSREAFAMIDAMGAQLQMAFGLLLSIGVYAGRWLS
jgi:1,4-dihydroxy-2-naphthoate octaprenyltransferase